MYKIRVYINKEYGCYNDGNVSIDIELPAVPSRGEVLNLSDDMIHILEEKAKADLEIARDYANKWFYYKSYNCDPHDIKYENLQDLGFSDAIIVTSVMFSANSEIIEILLDSILSDE